MNSPLLATKLHQPALPPKRVPRPQLTQRLNEGLEAGRHITLVSAPAGFGKTVCVAGWVRTLDCSVAWLTLEPADDEPERFLGYFLAALQLVKPGIGEEIASLLRAGQLPPAEVVSTTLLNELFGVEARLVMVLDDLQVIQDPYILQVLQALVGKLPPAFNLVLLTREDPDLPLARLRANNQLTEIRAGDLRFTRSETSAFLNQVMGLALAPADTDALADKTEGWAAGLQLAGLSIRERVDPSDFIASLTGAHRYILSYLTEEVLNQQPPEVQDFLLATSILERLHGALCDAVAGRTGSALVLEQLLSANLFLIPLDETGRWYRYHQLFAELLADRRRTRPAAETDELHRRASRWYAQAGLPGDAVDHALAAADYVSAVELIEANAADMLMQWHKKRVQDWMHALPPEWAARCPRTTLALTWMLLSVDLPQALAYLERLRLMLNPDQLEADPVLHGQWLALQASLANGQGRPAEGIELAQQALAVAPDWDHRSRSMVYTALATAYQLSDNYDRAVGAFQLLIQHGRHSANLDSEMLGRAGLALLAMQHGRLHFAFEVASQGIERVERSGMLPPITQAVHGELGEIYYQWHQLEQAHKHFQRAIQVATLSGFSDATLYYDVILSRLHQIEGDLQGAVARLDSALRLMKAEAPAAVRDEVVSQQVRVCLAQNQLAAAELALLGSGTGLGDWLLRSEIPPEHAISRASSLQILDLLRILLYRATNRSELASLDRAIELADRLIDRALARQHLPMALKALLLRGQMHGATGDEQAYLDDVARAVALAESEGAISIFIEEGKAVAEALAKLLTLGMLDAVAADFVRRILAAFAEPAPSARPGDEPAPATLQAQSQPASVLGLPAAVEPLSERELDVLRLMADGLTYQEIAGRLFISLNTVRSHVKAVYGKLGANNRTQAISLARRQELI